MSRDKGLSSFSANFEPQVAAPLDARDKVATVADLTLAATWTANDGGIYAYVGMDTNVTGDPTPTNNGKYILTSADYTNINNWSRIGAGAVTPTGIISKIAGEALGGHRVVVVGSGGEAFYADNTNLDHASVIIGITTGAISLGAIGTIRYAEEINEPSWSWTLNIPVFLNGTTGEISQTPPLVGFSQIIGFPTSPTSLIIRIDRPIILS